MAPIPITPRSALAVMAHPDDIEFMAGGLIARWAREGTELHYCLLTDGQSGSRDPHQSPVELARTRRDEQRHAAEVFNVASCTFLGYTDGRIIDTIDLRLQIARVIRRTRPEAVVTSDPQFFYRAEYANHPDHRITGAVTLAAIMPFANTYLAAPELAAEGLEPHDVSSVYIAFASSPTVWVPVEPQDFERQVEAMGRHTSQVQGWDFAVMLRGFGQQTAEEARANGVECQQAERYAYINLSRDDR